jgi:hypothetical protein
MVRAQPFLPVPITMRACAPRSPDTTRPQSRAPKVAARSGKAATMPNTAGQISADPLRLPASPPDAGPPRVAPHVRRSWHGSAI